MTPTEEILARYKVTAKAVDTFGRTWTVRKLRPSQETAMVRIAGGGNADLTNMVTIVGCVAFMVDEKGNEFPFPIPRTMAQIDDLLDLMDQEGLKAVGEAMKDLAKKTETFAAPTAPGTAPGDPAFDAANADPRHA